MRLVDAFGNDINRKDEIIVVEPQLPDPRRYNEQKDELEGRLSEINGRNIGLINIDHEGMNDRLQDLDPSMVLFNHSLNIVDILNSVKLRQDFPNLLYFLFARGDMPMFKRTLNELMGVLSRNEFGGIDGLVNGFELMHPYSYTVVDTLLRNSKSIEHDVKNVRDKRFKARLSVEHTKGNLQSTEAKTFLMLSDTHPDTNGKFDFQDQDIDVTELDYDRYHAIFVDNNDLSKSNDAILGNGRKVLELLANEIGDRQINIPIFYQSGHDLSEFSKEDLEFIASHNNTHLISKNYAPKVSRSKKVAIKELSVSEALARNPFISQYTVRTIPIGEEGYVRTGNSRNKRFLTFSEAASIRSGKDDKKLETLRELNLEDNLTNHKFYVLAHFHTGLKDHLEDEKFAGVSSDYFEFTDIHHELTQLLPGASSTLLGLKNQYNAIVDELKVLTPTVIGHNDAKPDNWFNGNILGDYGSVAPGREYKDIAKSLLDPSNGFKDALNKDMVDQSIRDYMTLRKSIDSDFIDDEIEFRNRVYGSIVTESLRTAKYKVATNIKLADALINVASTYSEILSD